MNEIANNLFELPAIRVPAFIVRSTASHRNGAHQTLCEQRQVWWSVQWKCECSHTVSYWRNFGCIVALRSRKKSISKKRFRRWNFWSSWKWIVCVFGVMYLYKCCSGCARVLWTKKTGGGRTRRRNAEYANKDETNEITLIFTYNA